MSALDFRLPSADDLLLLQRWNDEDTQEFLTLRFYIGAWSWLVPCSAGDTYSYRRIWVIEDSGQPVGILDSEAKSEHCAIAIYIAPDKRGEGYGKAIIDGADIALRQYLKGEEVFLKASVHADNKASTAIFAASIWHKGEPYCEDGQWWTDFTTGHLHNL